MRKVLIVGGGIAGLSAMRFLTAQGFDMSLIEKAPELRAEGAGIMLGINAMKILGELGLEQEVIECGQVLKSFSMVNRSGSTVGVSDAEYMEAQTGYKTIGIHRRELHRILSKDIDTENLFCNTMIERIEEAESGVLVDLDNGRSENFDLVIAADGIHSSTRALAGQPSYLRYAGYTCWRFVIDQPEGLDSNRGYEYWGSGRRFGIVPLGFNQLYCFATLNADEGDEKYCDITVREFKELFAEFGGVVPNILRHLKNDDVLIHGDLKEQRAVRLKQGCIAFIGDASHAATPNMGQGAAMALEDAYVLSDCLKKENDVPAALQQFEKRRIDRVKLIRDRSFMAGKIAQWEGNFAMGFRNTLFRMMPKKGLSKDLCELLLDY